MEGHPLQTFLPYDDFDLSAQVLDRQRLGKQRVKNLQILQTLLGVKVGNTTRQVHTGKFRIAYFDDDGREIEWGDDGYLCEPGDYQYEQVPVYDTVLTDKSEWSLHVIPNAGWQHHQATKMWRGHEWLLLDYQRAICDEWVRRGFVDTCFSKSMFIFLPHLNSDKARTTVRPRWLGDKAFHLSHQSNLIRKDPEHYWELFPGVPDDLPYIWPTESE